MKHIAIIPIMLLALAATAQTKATVEHGAESKKTTAQYMATAKQIGTYEGLNCWVGTAKDERLTVTLTDHNLEPMRSMELPEGADMRVLATTIDGNKARLLLAEEGYRNMTLIYTASIDLDSMRPEAGTLPLVQIDSVGYGKKDDCKVWGAASANGGHLGYVLIVEYKDRKQYSARTVVLDRQLKEEWNKEFAMGSMDEIAVADDGTVVTLGYEEEGEMTHFIFNVIGARKADSYDVAVKCDPVRELHLAGVTGRYAMGMGLFRPDGSKPDENLTGGVIGMAFQIDYAELSGFVMRPFQNEDLNILENKKTKKIQREQMMDYVSMNALTLTHFGAVIAAGRNYQRTYSEDNGLTSNEYHRMGLHMVAIDTAANIKWVRNVRRNDVQKNDDGLLRTSLIYRNGKTLLIKSESPKYPSTYDIAKEAKEYKVDSKGNIVMYCIGNDGEVEKLTLLGKSPYKLLTVGEGVDGRLLIMTANGKRTRQTKLKIEN